MNSKAAREYILKRLKEELPPERSYHCLEHTLDVYAAAIDIAEKEGVNGKDLLLVKTAALYHDCGFLDGGEGHEERGCHIARESLPVFGYDHDSIERICGMIMATEVPQKPTNHLEEILCDADLDYLGRADFERIGGLLYEEFKRFGIVQGVEDWDELQVSFLTPHRYFTKTNREGREQKKAENLQKVIARVQSRK